MRTIKTIVYSFDELSDDAKQNAIEWYRSIDNEWYFMDECLDSIKAFCRETGITLKNYELGGYPNSIDWEYSLSDCELTDLNGLRLRTWILNNWGYFLSCRKYRKSIKCRDKEFYHPMVTWMISHISGQYYGLVYSNFKNESDCPFTGVCYDEDLLKPVREFIKSPDNRNLEDLINDCFGGICSTISAEMEYQSSDEYIIETIQANDYEFTESGKCIN